MIRKLDRKPDLYALETEIDECGLELVLDAIAEICHGKADHVASAWQDREMARAWTRAAKAIEHAVARAAIKLAPL
jgi:hypothetical protein